MTDQLHDATRSLIAAESEDEVVQAAVSGFTDLTGADRCDVALVEDDGLTSRASVTFGPPETDFDDPVQTHEELLAHALDIGSAGLIDDLTAVRRVEAAGGDEQHERYRSLLCVPIGTDGLLVATHRERGFFSSQELASVTRLSEYVAAALERCGSIGPDDPSRGETVASVVSHDVQNAIAVANARLDLARTEVESEHLDAVADAHGRLLDLTEDLVVLLRTGDSVDSIEPVDLASESRRAWTTIDGIGPTLEVEESATVLADRSSLCQLLENLFRNAADHGGEDVTVRVGTLSGEPGFFVEDDGPGIPPAERETVLEMGYTTGQNSTGYGLAIVTRIAEAHAWDVDVTAGRDGGARIEVTGVEFV